MIKTKIVHIILKKYIFKNIENKLKTVWEPKMC